jgi:ABC-type uncharacterized transport system ATPase subunit/ABC-type uncharacterized transport system permease subunit
MASPLLELRNITKSYGPKVANDRVSLTVLPGRIHALVGENGAGKTTLMTMIAGTARPDEGTILVDGRETAITSPQKASSLGIGMVHQHFKLVPSLTVAANVFLGRELRTRRGSLDVPLMEQRVRELSERFGLQVDPTAKVSTLSVGLRQRVEVLKALSHDTRLLILDEPTAVLTPGEIDDLFVVVRELARKGCAVLFISHKLREVLSIADEVTVIRDGRTIGTLPAAGLSEADIARMMVGREVLLRIDHTPANPTDEVLTVRRLSVVDTRGVPAVDDVSFEVRAGEIIGIAGVEGNGQSELLAAIAGMGPMTGGEVVLGGRSILKATVAQRRAAGLAYIPEDRYAEGTAPGLSVAENLAATHLRPPVARFGFLSGRGVRSLAQRLIRRFDVRGATPNTPVGALSGGNMQKVVIAREFEAEPRLLMVSQPTRGVDVGAMEFVHNALVAARDRGAGVLLSSADLNEVMSLSDRLLVMYRGRIVAMFTQDDMTETAVGLAMAGAHVDDRAVAEAEAEHEKIVEQVATQEQVPQAPAGGPRGPQPAVRADASGAPPPARPETSGGSRAAQPPVGGVSGGSRGAGPPVGADDQPAGPSLVRELATKTFTNSVQPIVAVVLSLLVGMVIILALGDDPIAAYKELFFSSWQTPQGFGGLVAQLIPLLVLSSAVIVSFRAGFFNIGGEGQLYVGAFAGAWVGFTFPSVPGPLLVVLMFLAAFAAGGLWGLIPGALLAYWRVDIIVTTLMMSSIAVLLTAYFVTGPFKDPAAGLAGSPKVPDDTLLPVFDPEYGLGLDLVIGLVVIVVLGLVLTRSVWGLRIRELGQMNRFAEYTGVNSRRMTLQVMLVSGAVAGLAGIIFVLGPNGGRFLQTFSPGYGFLGITVALLARLNPWAAIVAAVFYANMMAGSNSMQVNTDVPYPLVNVLQGLIILFITATVLLGRRRRVARESAGADGSPVPGDADSAEDTTHTAFASATRVPTTLEEGDRS